MFEKVWLKGNEWTELGMKRSRRAGIESELASRVEIRVLRLFGHVERMDKYRMARRALMAAVIGGRIRGRPRLGWTNDVKVKGGLGQQV